MTPHARPAKNVAFCDFAIQSVALLNVRLRKNAVRKPAKFTRALVNSARNDALDVSQVAFPQREYPPMHTHSLRAQSRT